MRKRRLLIEKIALLFISIIVLVVLIFTAGLVDPAVQFADPGLEAAVREKLEKPEKPIHKSDLLTITELDASGREISNLQGVEYLRQLVNLNLADNFVKDLTPLASLYKLNELNLRNNEIVDLEEVNFEAITGLPIRKLNLQYNVVHQFPGGEIRLEDIRPLRNLTLLEELELRYNHIEDINALSRLTNLKVLDLRDNLITDISPLKNLTALEELNLRDNDLGCIAPLADLEELLYLNIHSNNNIESIQPLSGLINLQTLIMRNVPVGDQITALLSLTNLQRLNIRNCSISDAAVIGELMAEGALQDDPETGEVATLSLRGNQLFIEDEEYYYLFKKGWTNITNRDPVELPRIFSSLDPPTFSHRGGFYDEGFLLTITTDDPEVEIYYTLDGSEPCPSNTGGSLYFYKNQYPIQPGDYFGDLISRSYITYPYVTPIFMNGNINGNSSIININVTYAASAPKPMGTVFHGRVIRAMAYKEGYPSSSVVTNSYFIGEGIQTRYHLPVVSLVTAESNLFDYETGIYVAGKTFDEWRKANPNEVNTWYCPGNYRNGGIAWEKEANLEIFSPSGELLLNQVTGVRIHGGATRAWPNKSLRFYARSEYGKSLLNIKLFYNKTTNQFKRFILRNSGNDSSSTMFRDAMMHSLIQELRIDQQAYQPAILFINGVYWGLYNIRDRIDRYHLFYEHGVDPYKIDLLRHNAKIIDGSNNHYIEMIEYLKTYDITDPSVYRHLNTMIDIGNFINLSTSQIYFGNIDWLGNISYWRLSKDQYDPEAPYGHDGRWRWIIYDTDYGFGLEGPDTYKHNTLEFSTEAGGNSWPNQDWSTFLLRTLLKNNYFKVDFINRFADHLNTIFLSEVVLEQINDMQDNIAPLMQEHINRWGQLEPFLYIFRGGQPESIEKWKENVEVMKAFAQNRPEYLRKHIVDYFGLNGTVSIRLITDFSKGTIKVNTINVGKLLLDTNESEWSGIYFQDVPIKITAVPKPGYIFAGWKEIEENFESLDLTLTEDQKLTAVFVEQQNYFDNNY